MVIFSGAIVVLLLLGGHTQEGFDWKKLFWDIFGKYPFLLKENLPICTSLFHFFLSSVCLFVKRKLVEGVGLQQMVLKKGGECM